MPRLIKPIIFIVFLVGLIACQNNAEKSKGPADMEQQDINIVLKAHSPELMAIPGVVGIYVGAVEEGGEERCITIMVKELTPELKKGLPEKLGGHLVKIEVTGEIKAL
ncbi:MAG: hypothetical protein DWQ05_21995 [Calditrichaeota bacterium]|nr:MAG: hypothetical protein DWQ05_21995 [Calditrichota bacterium]